MLIRFTVVQPTIKEFFRVQYNTPSKNFVCSSLINLTNFKCEKQKDKDSSKQKRIIFGDNQVFFLKYKISYFLESKLKTGKYALKPASIVRLFRP